MIGSRVGAWTVVASAGVVRGYESWTVRCDCGLVCDRTESSIRRNTCCPHCRFRAGQEKRSEREERHALTRAAMPQVERVRNTTRSLLISSALERKTACEECGSAKGVVVHHRNYCDARDIAHLCKGCHQREHRRLRNEGRDPILMFALWLSEQRSAA